MKNIVVLRVQIQNKGEPKMKKVNPVEDALEREIQDLLARQPDVLDAHQIARITGYASRTVSRWCTEGRLKSFPYQHSYKVPKEWLLEFLTSEDYNSITRKSKEHYAMIAAVAPKPRRARKKN